MPPILAAAIEHLKRGRYEQAASSLRGFLQRFPSHPDGNHLMGMALYHQGRYEEAEPLLRRAVSGQPRSAVFRTNLAHLLMATRRSAEAAEQLKRALQADPRHAAAHGLLCRALMRLKDYDGAAAAGRMAVQLAPAIPNHYGNLAGALTLAGRMDEVIATLQRGLRQAPGALALHDYYLAALNHLPQADPGTAAAIAREYGRMVERSVKRLPPPTNDPTPDRRLNVGYLSGDLREHSVAYFLEPLLEHHDRGAVRVVCYATNAEADGTTERLRGRADAWVDAASMNDDALAERIRADGIDILVELAGHTITNRLPAVARGPAPVQATYIGYPGTTGLSSVGYRLVDSLTDPDGFDAFATESLVRLDPCFLCYRPPDEAPEVGPPPCLANGFVTFGSFNALPKMVPEVVALWARLLEEVPGSRLLLKNRSFADAAVQRQVRERFSRAGVSDDRLLLEGPAKSTSEHLGYYGRVDIGLDPFPYNGTTTTCEALWMGVPVVSLAGDRHAARVGLSLLSVVGLGDLCAADESGYVEAAKSLARSPDRLAELRSGMRDRLRGSALLDGPGHARRVEEAYRRMWQAWCRTKTGGGTPS